MGDEPQHVIEVAGQQYDLDQSTVPIAEEDAPAPTDIIQSDDGPGGTVILQTRNHIYIRYVDGTISRLQLAEGTDLETLRRGQAPVIANVNPSDPPPPPPKKPKESLARVSKRMEQLSERVDQQLERNSKELAEMRELLQSCLESITAKVPVKEVSKDKGAEENDNIESSDKDKSGISSERDSESDYVSVSENEQKRRKKKKKKRKKTAPLNFTTASASTRINEPIQDQLKTTKHPTVRDENDPSSSSSSDESEGGAGSQISSILADRTKRPSKNKSTSFSSPLENGTARRESATGENRTSNRRNDSLRSTGRNSTRSSNSIPIASFASKSLQKMHQESIDIEPYQGPNRDSRAPLFFLEQFRRQVVDSVDSDRACGEMFYGNLKKSKWCRQWIDKIQVHMGFERMEKVFLQMEWTNQTQLLFFKQFEAANQNNSQFINFLDFYNYWRERIKGVEVSDRYVIEHFRNNMPTRVQMLVDVTKIKKLKHFDELIKKIPESDLAWHELSNPQTIEKREELLAKDDTKISSGDTKRPFQKFVPNPEYKKLSKVNHICANCSCSLPEEDGGGNNQNTPSEN